MHRNGPDAARRIAALEAEVAALKDERTDLYKSNAASAQRILALVDARRDQDDAARDLADRADQLAAANKALTTRLADAEQLVKEKDGVIQILRDELATHQLELVQREEQLRDAERKARDLEADNKELLDRWMALKQKEIAQMNEANEFVEAALKTKASAKKRESFFPLFRSGASSPSGEPADESRRQSAANRATLPTTLAKKTASPAPPTAHDLEINCIAIRRDGSMIATGSNDKKLILHDAKTCAQKAVLTGSLQAVMSVSFNSTGDFVIGTSNDNSAKIWSVATSRLKHTLTGHIGRVYSARFSDSNGVVTGSHDRTIKIWDLNKGYCIKTIFTLSSCNDLALLGGEGAVIASGHLDNNLRIWDARSGNIIREVTGIHFGQITSVEVSPQLGHILTTSRDNTIKLIDLRTYAVVTTFADESFRTGMNWTKSTFSPDGEYVTSGSADGAVVFWDVATGAVVQSLREHKAAVCGVVWNPLGGSAVYSASDRDRCIVQWGV